MSPYCQQLQTGNGEEVLFGCIMTDAVHMLFSYNCVFVTINKDMSIFFLSLCVCVIVKL